MEISKMRISVVQTDQGPMGLVQLGTKTEEEMLKLKEKIHHTLVGRKDYIDCDIILNGTDDNPSDKDIAEHAVNVFFDIAHMSDAIKVDFEGGKEKNV